MNASCLTPRFAKSFAVLCAVLFVGSLYVRGTVTTHRDDPREVKRRMLSVTLAALLLVALLYFAMYDAAHCAHSFAAIVGVRASALFGATVRVALLGATLFAGPLLQRFLDASDAAHDDIDVEPHNERRRPKRRRFWPTLHQFRTVIFAPALEEIVFRSLTCAALRLGEGWSHGETVLGSAALFGAAHAHHAIHHVMVERVRKRDALLMVLFQFSYTFVFGALAAHLYLVTGHLLAVSVLHGFCNVMGVPDFDGVRESRVVALVYVAGLLLFAAQLAGVVPLLAAHHFDGNPFQ